MDWCHVAASETYTRHNGCFRYPTKKVLCYQASNQHPYCYCLTLSIYSILSLLISISLTDIGRKWTTHFILGYGNQKGIIKNYRGAEYAVNLLPKIKVETVVADEVAPKLIDKIVEQINTGHIGDGKIFMYEVEDAIRIRTGEHGVDAL